MSQHRPLGRRSFVRTGLLTAGALFLPAKTTTSASAATNSGLSIHDRASWGAAKPLRRVQYSGQPPRKIIVHHTATPNTQELDLGRAYALARAMQHYHQQALGWSDSGQHFTVSRGGHLLEGREHSLRELRRGEVFIIGSHCANQNTVSIGIETEGNYCSSAPSQTQYAALVEMCAEICRQYEIAPGEIFGHRDFNATACPGDVLYAMLPGLRSDVAQAIVTPCGAWQAIGGPTPLEELVQSAGPAQGRWPSIY
ncbi:peptidoglycan recognition family protein [Streptomyces sp. NPDC005533]|uniref:peptidoglycan recognition protein family protein n=1 Tax=Streptomyces sp. NPDC005533 TaxID=3364723 RepID=UPI0036A51221